MELQKEIKKPAKFRNEYEKTIVNLYYTNCFLQSDFDCIYKEFGVTSQQYTVLRILRSFYPACACIGMLKERMLDKNSDITRIVTRLKRKKFVSRKVCPQDNRRMEIKITPKGINLTLGLDKKINWRVDKVFTHINKAEMEIVNRVLDKVRDYHTNSRSLLKNSAIICDICGREFSSYPRK